MRLILLSLPIVFLISACSSSEKINEEKPKSLFETEAQPKMVNAVDATVDTTVKRETSKSDSVLLTERFRSAYNSNNEDAIVNAGSEILSLNPNDPIVLKALGLFYEKQKKSGIAKIYFSRVLDKDPRNSTINNSLGVIALEENNEVEAQRFFKIALQGDSSHTEANYNLGTLYLKYNDYEKAVRLLEKAYINNKRDVAIANNFAISLRGTGQIDRALDVYKSMDSKGADSRGTKVQHLLNHAILLSVYKKDSKEAREVLNRIRFVTTDSQTIKKVNELSRLIDQK